MFVVLRRRLNGQVVYLVTSTLLPAYGIIIGRSLLIGGKEPEPVQVHRGAKSIVQSVEFPYHIPSAHCLLLLHHFSNVLSPILKPLFEPEQFVCLRVLFVLEIGFIDGNFGCEFDLVKIVLGNVSEFSFGDNSL